MFRKWLKVMLTKFCGHFTHIQRPLGTRPDALKQSIKTCDENDIAPDILKAAVILLIMEKSPLHQTVQAAASCNFDVTRYRGSWRRCQNDSTGTPVLGERRGSNPGGRHTETAGPPTRLLLCPVPSSPPPLPSDSLPIPLLTKFRKLICRGFCFCVFRHSSFPP